MTRLAIAAVVVSSWVLAQSKPVAPARDAGVVSVKPAPSVDAGVPEPMRGPAPVSGAEVEKLKKEVAELRARTTELEAKAAKADALAADVKKLEKRLDEVKAQLDAVEERRERAEQDAAQRKAQVTQANATVNGVLTQLSTGNTANVDAWLRGVEQQYGGNAGKLVALARGALGQGDLNAARQYLNLALIEAASTAP
jgi:uncharacterized phage infection (PIP) family protein YhgE